jgi:predicted nucleic acid-binding Zn ribbon protein
VRRTVSASGGAPEPGDGGRGAGRRRRARDPGPRPLGDALDALVADLGAPGPAGAGGPERVPAGALGQAFARWEEIAGEAMARHVRPLRWSGGVLVLAADHPAWATQARADGTGLSARVRDLTGAAPERIEVTVRRP